MGTAAVSADSISRGEGPTSFIPSKWDLWRGGGASIVNSFRPQKRKKGHRREPRKKWAKYGDRKQEPKFGRKVSKATERECEKRRAEKRREGKSLDTFGEGGRKSNGMAREGEGGAEETPKTKVPFQLLMWEAVFHVNLELF